MSDCIFKMNSWAFNKKGKATWKYGYSCTKPDKIIANRGGQMDMLDMPDKIQVSNTISN